MVAKKKKKTTTTAAAEKKKQSTKTKAKPVKKKTKKKTTTKKTAKKSSKSKTAKTTKKPTKKTKKKETKKAKTADKKTTKKTSSKKTVKKPVKKLSPLEKKIYSLLKDRSLPLEIIDELTEKIEKQKVSKNKIAAIVNQVYEDFQQNRIDPSEACGIIGAQSIGEPGTQMSLPYDEKIIVKQDDKIRICEIGEFVDQKINEYPVSSVQNAEVCDLPHNEEVFVPSLNQQEKVEWKRILSCSKHQNHGKILKLRTRSGRVIRATDAHSFVIRADNKIVPISGKDLTIGSRIPVIKRLEENCVGSLDLGSYLHIDDMNYAFEKNDFIYPYPSRRPLPKNMELDEVMGWFTGAYLAEGNATKYYTSISNVDEVFLENVRCFAQKYNLTFNEYDNNRGFASGHDIRINSSLLSSFMKKSCGTGASKKKIPDFAFSAKQDFVCGLLKGYFDGDGNVSVGRKSIRASSSSKDLIDGIALLLNRVGIFSSKHRRGNENLLRISYRYAPLFLEEIGLDNKKKREKLKELKRFSAVDHSSYDIIDMIPGFGSLLFDIAEQIGFPKRLVNNFTKRQRIGRKTLARYIQKFEMIAKEKKIDIDDQLQVLKRMMNGDVVWDEIREISYVDTDNEYVYDLSVDGLETFTTFDGVITHNTMRTFHYAGVAEINVTLGLPRLIEIVDARSAPSTPMMNIYLQEKYRSDQKMAKKVANKIEITELNDIAEIETDLTNLTITIKPNKETLENKGMTLKEVLKAVKKIRKTDAKEKKKTIVISLDEPSYKNLLDVNEKIKNLKVKGVNGINRIIIRKEPDEGYVIYSEGSNLKKVLEIEGVDPYRTTTNDIQAVGRELGVEAARNMIIQEAYATLSEQGLDVDKRHIMMVADVMTSDGRIKAIGRHGVSGEKTSVLSRAAFEITVNHLLHASRRGEYDYLQGVAENIIVGQPVNLGTGAVQLVMKRSKIKKKEKN